MSRLTDIVSSQPLGNNAMAKKKVEPSKLVTATNIPKVTANLNPAPNFWSQDGQFNVPGGGIGQQQPMANGMFGSPQMQQLIQQAMQRFGGGGMQGGPQGMMQGQGQPPQGQPQMQPGMAGLLGMTQGMKLPGMQTQPGQRPGWMASLRGLLGQ